MTEDACWAEGRRTEQDRYDHLMHMLWDHILRGYTRANGNQDLALGQKVFRGERYRLKVRDRIGAFGRSFPDRPSRMVIEFAGNNQKTGSAEHLRKRAYELYDLIESQSPGSGKEPWEAARYFLPSMLDPHDLESVRMSKSK